MEELPKPVVYENLKEIKELQKVDKLPSLPGIMDEVPNYPFYVLLLARFIDEEKFIARYIIKNWGMLDRLSGNNCLFVSPYPKNISLNELISSQNNYSPNKQEEFKENSTNPDWVIDYANILDIKYTEFPCLFIFTSVKKDNAIIVPLEEDKLSNFFDTIFQEMRETSKIKDENERLKKINKKINIFKMKQKLVKYATSLEYKFNVGIFSISKPAQTQSK